MTLEGRLAGLGVVATVRGDNVSRGVLVVEIRGSDGRLVTGSLADEAQQLVNQGKITEQEARYHLPGFSRA